ncbi:hypothetical protein M4I21_18505, partial [Cellulophaga sp. 20_2_10]|uniref:hypothetical protein n=1 Tax=Cellulophaga sp. 20_2_10 TaxID=2942476 RepID=UPI00201B34E4
KIINYLKPVVLLVITVFLITNCQKEETTAVEVAPQLELQEQLVSFTDLPEIVKLKALEAQSNLLQRNLSSKDKGNNFGNIVESNIKKLKNNDGDMIYTFGLSKNKGNNYMDMLTMKVNGSSVEANIIRHEPNQEWLEKGNSGEFKNFSGTVNFYDDQGNFYLSTELRDGEIEEKKTASKAGKTCTITNVQYFGLEQDGVFYVKSIRYTLSCREQSTGVSSQDLNNGQQETIDWLPAGEGGAGASEMVVSETITC